MSVVITQHPGHKSSARTHRSFPLSMGFLRESGLVAIAVYVYFFVRGLIHAREAEAMRHAHDLVSFEKTIGIFHERQFQSLILDHQWAVNLVNWIYIYGHWPVVISTLTWLFIKHREMFPVFRSAMIFSGLVGFAFFFLFPMAPPRLVDGLGLVDTVTLHSDSYRVLQPPSLTNPFAAMPSLHVGWNLLMGIAIVSMSTNRFWKVFGVLMPLAMYLATILTGNHYFTDGIVGSALALAGLAVAWKLFRPQPPVWQVVPQPAHHPSFPATRGA